MIWPFVGRKKKYRFEYKKSKREFFAQIPEHMKKRLMLIHSSKINREGELLLESTIYKSQHRNKQEVIDKLTALLIHASKKEKKRIKTTRTKSSIEKRLYMKKKRSNIKKLRSKPDLDDS